MIRLTNDLLGRMLHAPLYERLRHSCITMSPETPAEIAVNNWLTRLYNSDQRLHILVNLTDTYEITEHAVIDIIDAFGTNIVYCHFIVKDKPTATIVDEYMEYLDKLKAESNASHIAFAVSKNSRVYEKRYGYKAVRTFMVKSDTPTGEGA